LATDVPGVGQCPKAGGLREYTDARGGRYLEKGCTSFGYQKWHWMHREKFDAADLPPANGWRPPIYPEGLFQ
jgi:hypothetical protein